MKKLLIILLACCLAGSVSADSLGGLVIKLRDRVGEPDAASSFFSDATARSWLNLATERAYWLTASGHRDTGLSYHPDTNMFEIPATREVRSVHAKVGTRWYDITGDPQALDMSVVRSDSALTSGGTAQWSRVYLQIGGFVPRVVDVAWHEDSVSYKLPSDFRKMDGMMVRSNGKWGDLTVMLNPLFLEDNDVVSYFVGQTHIDTASLYVRTKDLVEDDTMRVFYLAGPVAGDSVRISYFSQFTPMSADSVECLIDDDMEGFVIEEAVRYYFDAIRNWNGSQIMQQDVRQDIGGGQ